MDGERPADNARDQSDLPPQLPGGRSSWSIDLAGGALIATFVAWVITGPGASRADTVFDFGIFFAAGGLVAALQLGLSHRALSTRERLGWRLLASGSAVRIASGAVWALWLIEHGSAPRPWWLLIVTASSLALGVLGLLAFSAEGRDAVDRDRQLLDAVIVGVGSATVLWYSALGPLFEATGPRAARLEDFVYAVSDGISAIVAAVVFLRSRTRYMRTVMALMFAAHLVQAVPDVLFWAGKVSYSYRSGDAISVLWFSVWTIKGITARYAAHTLDNPTEGAFEPDSEYRSGFLPHALVILATMLLLVQLGDPEPRRALPLIFSTGSLVLLLIVRQAVELREQSRLQQAQRVDAEWHGALLRDAYDFVLVVDPSGRTLHATPMAERMLGGAPVLARPWGLLDIGHPEDRAGLSAAVDAGAASPTEVRFRVRTTPTEDWRELMLRVTDRRRDPAVGAVVLSGHDVTRESRLSGRLQKGADLEALGVFAGGLAHDLNNILTVIDAHAEMLLDDVPAAHPVREDLIGVRRASARARRLTRGLLSLSRSKGAAPGVIDVAGLLASRIDAAQLVDTVSVRSGAAAPSVRVDRHSLTLAIDALLLTILEADPAIEHATFAVGTGRFDETEAAELGIAVGPHVVLSLDGALPAWPAPGVGTALGGVDDSLPMLMAHAAVRECGGTLRTLSSGRITLHLPTGGAV